MEYIIDISLSRVRSHVKLNPDLLRLASHPINMSADLKEYVTKIRR